jgi:uncharacterized membrane protein YfcA
MAVGILLIIIPLLLLFQRRIEERVANRPPTMRGFAGMVVIGLVAGFLVGMTSVGSGSIIMMLLLLFYSFPPKVNVGTDIVHAVVLTGVTGFLHFRLADRFDSGGAPRFASFHPHAHPLAAASAVRSVVDYRGAHVVAELMRRR